MKSPSRSSLNKQPAGVAEPGRLSWLVAASLIAGGLGWYWFSSYAVPRCDARETLEAMTSGKFVLHEIHQAGYAWSRKIRGCLAKVEENGKLLPYAYTIERVEGRRNSRLVYDYAQPRLIAQRFGQIAWHGDFAGQAEPIGREAMLKAMLAGMDTLRGKPLTHMSLVALLSPHHYREIGDIEALAPCRQASPGLYACRLLIERNDLRQNGPMTVWASSVLQEGDITFQRGKDKHAWTVTPQFGEELSQAR